MFLYFYWDSFLFYNKNYSLKLNRENIYCFFTNFYDYTILCITRLTLRAIFCINTMCIIKCARMYVIHNSRNTKFINLMLDKFEMQYTVSFAVFFFMSKLFFDPNLWHNHFNSIGLMNNFDYKRNVMSELEQIKESVYSSSEKNWWLLGIFF